MDKKIVAVLVILGIAMAGIVVWGMTSSKSNEPAASLAGIIYYYGAECPHCKKVNEFLDANAIAEKVTFTKKEVWHNRENAREMTAAAEQCGIDKNNIGVPFIFDDGKCLIGEPDVIKFFSEKAGLTQ